MPALLILAGAICLGTSGTAARMSPMQAALAAPVRSCSVHQLALSFVGSDGAMGHIADMFKFRNVSGTACTLYGYPGAALLNAQQRNIPAVVFWGGGYLAGKQKKQLVWLGPAGGVGYFTLEWDDVTSGNQGCPIAHYVRITPPNAKRSLLLALKKNTINACGGILRASPVEPKKFNF